MRFDELLNDIAPPAHETAKKVTGWATQTIQDARLYIMRNRRAGVQCPACGNTCKVYRRTLTAGMARWLLLLVKEWQHNGHNWVMVNKKPLVTASRGGDYAKLQWWGLAENAPNKSTQTRSSGQWRPTPEGVKFAQGLITVPQYCEVYQNRVVEFGGNDIDIRDALGTKYDYKQITAADR